jgi:L-rhamnose mutarotase
MRRVIVRYKVKPGRAEENAELVRAVYEELAQAKPEGLRYATFQLEDGVSFVHLAISEDEHNPLTEVEAFKRFQENIRERCEEPPLSAAAREIGSYRL